MSVYVVVFGYRLRNTGGYCLSFAYTRDYTRADRVCVLRIRLILRLYLA